jgi:FMN-dependent NADH-azoreductase
MAYSLKGTHIATGQPVEVELGKREVLLITAIGGDINGNWEKAMDLITMRTGIEIIGQVDLETITIDGVEKPFH